MAERLFVKSADYLSVVRANAGTVLTALVSSPGSTPAEVQTATSLAQVIVDQVLAYAVKAGVVVARADFSGVVRYWRGDTWTTRILTYITNARTWGDGVSSSGALEGALATILVTAGLASKESQPVAIALVNVLVGEATGETA